METYIVLASVGSDGEGVIVVTGEEECEEVRGERGWEQWVATLLAVVGRHFGSGSQSVVALLPCLLTAS